MKHFLKRMLLVALLCVPWVTQAQTDTLTVADGGGTNSYVPFYGVWMDASQHNQVIYPASMTTALVGDSITGIGFYMSSTNSSAWNAPVTISLGITGASALSGLDNTTALTQVWQGTVSGQGNIWIQFDTAYAFMGGNLLLDIQTTSATYSSSSFFGTSQVGGSICTYNSSNLSQDFVPKTSFLHVEGDFEACNMPSNLVAEIDATTPQISLSWNPAEDVSGYNIYIGDSLVAGSVTDTFYVLYDLLPNTLYFLKVSSVCGDNSESPSLSGLFRTACIGSTPIPFYTGFEDVASGEMPSCWSAPATGNSGSGTFPSVYEYPSNARSGNIYFEFESNSGQTEIAVLPLMDDINTLQIDFYAACMNANFTLEVGVIENNTVFVPVDTVTLTTGVGGNWHNSYNPYTVYFDQYEGNGTNIAMRVTGSGSYTLMIDDITVSEIPSCLPPHHIVVDSIGANWVGLSWTDVNGTSWEILYDTIAFNPDDNELTAEMANDVHVVLENLLVGREYTLYLRGNCGGDNSPWVGPYNFIPGTVKMSYSGTDTVRGCGLVVYDDGGIENDYTVYANSMLVLYPSSDDSLIVFSGSTDIYGYYAKLRVYDGVGTSGSILWESSDYTETIPPITSFSGPITIHFNAGSYTSSGYTGFELHTSCIAAPQCASIRNLHVQGVSTSSAYVDWTVSGLNLGVPTGYEVNCYDSLGTLAYSETTTTLSVMITNLEPANPYTVMVRTICGDDDFGAFDSIKFNTASLACVEMNMDNSHFDTIGNGTSTSTYVPVYTCYNYSLTQQIYKASELNGGGDLTTISFMPSSVATPNGTSRNIEIYFAHIADSTAANFVYPDDLTLCYSGSPTFVADQWCEIELDQIFSYNGSDNLLVIFRDMTGVFSCSNNWYVHNADNNASRYVYQDSGPYSIGYTGGTSTNDRMNAVFGFIECTQLATCAAPMVVVDTVSTDYIGISWGAGYQETSWIVEYRPDTSDTWISAGTTTTTSMSFSNLTTNLRYHFRVGAVCSDTTIFTEVNARTKCGFESLPFMNGFENFPSSGTPSCWYNATSNSYGSYPYATTSYAHNGSQSLYMYSSSGTYSYIVLPELDAPIDTLEMSFWMYAPYTGYANELVVGVMSDAENYSTFQNVGIVSISDAATWAPVKVRFNNYHGNGTRIAIVSPMSDYVDVYIDDITVNIVSPCNDVENISLQYATIDSAILVWDSLSVEGYEYAYCLSGLGLDSTTRAFTTQNSAVIGNLSPNTQYDFYVRAICGGGDTSNWNSAFSFRTECLKITSVPYNESFENNVSGWNSNYSQNFYPCWYRENNPNNTYYYPYVYGYNAHTGNNSLYWNWSNTDNFNPWIVLPAIDTNVINISDMMLSFWAYNGYSNYVPTIVVGTMTNPHSIATFQALDTVVFTNLSYAKYEISLSNYSGNGEYVAMLGIAPSNGSTYWYGYMDDITIDSIPSCMHVYDLALNGTNTNSATISWNEVGSATTWEIAVETAPTTTPTADTTVMGSTTATVNGLTFGTTYYFYVRSICSATDVSAWEGPVMGIPGSWFMRPNMTDTLIMCNGIITDDGGPSGDYSSNQESYIIIRPETPGALLSVEGISYTESTYDHLHIYDGEGDGGVELWNDYGVSASQNFGPFISSSGPITLYFKSDGSVVYSGFEVNVSCYTDNCPVIDLMLDESVAPSSNSLTVTWTGSSSSYDVAYGPAGFDVDNATDIFNTTSNSYVVTGLSPITSYDIYVRGLCNSGDTGMWHKVTLRTPLCDNATIVENWDTNMSATTSNYSPIGYSFYNYSYTQTIVDSAFLAGLENEIVALEFMPSVTTGGSYFTHMTVYMANVSESDLSTDFIRPDDSAHIFVPVIVDRDFSYSSTNPQMHGLDTSFMWDGHSNILVAVSREHGTWTSGATFYAHDASADKTRYIYQDGSPYDITTVSGGASTSATGDLRLYSCGASCPMPTALPATNITYEAATLNWNSSAEQFEVAVKAATDASWPAEVTVANSLSLSVNGLQPETQYQFRVRAICDATENLVSDWTEGTFTTAELPCFAPENLHTTDLGYTTATLAWTADAGQNQWDIHVWNSTFDTNYVANASTFTVTGLKQTLQYNAAVKAICGGGLAESEYGDTIQFTTATCVRVAGVNVTDITASSAVVSWTSAGVSTYIIEYGDRNFSAGSGTTVTVENATSYTLTGLDEDWDYSVLVKAVCEPGVEGEWSVRYDFTTPEGTTAVNTVEGGMNLAIYPNPTSDATTIALSGVNGEVNITIVDMNGRIVKSETMSCEGDCTKRMEVSGLAQGAYFVRVNGENLNMVRKLVVK